MEDFFDLLPSSFFRDTEKDLATSVVVALARKKKIVSGKTAQSVRAATISEGRGFAELGAFGGEGMRYIIEGKRANTKLPVKRVGGNFELVQGLKDWKALVGFKGSDWLLANAIAKKRRAGVDIPGEALNVFNERYLKSLQSTIFDAAIEQFRQENEDGTS